MAVTPARVEGNGGKRKLLVERPDGKREVELAATLEGYEGAERKITPRPGDRRQIALALEPLPAVYRVTLEPEEAELVIEGAGAKVKGSGSERRIEVGRPDGKGSVSILARLEGYRSMKGDWVPRPGDNKRAEWKLEKMSPPPPTSPADKPGTVTTNSIGMKLALIPAGEFDMGSPESEEGHGADEGPVHRVRITKPFYLGVYEVTQDEYAKVTGKSPSLFKGDGRLPVETVSWYDAVNFCNLLSQKEGLPAYYELTGIERDGDTIKGAVVTEKNNGGYRLPTEAEWEYACRAGTRTPFHYGASLSSTQANFDGNYPYGGAGKGPYLEKTARVGSYQPNAFGLFDMHGNVWEWCQDWYSEETYANGTGSDPRGPNSGTDRVLRGGSWVYLAVYARAAGRLRDRPDYRSHDYGFRAVRTRIP